MTALPVLDTIEMLATLVRSRPTSYVRYSRGPDADAETTSVDTESGLELPGLSVNPLDAEDWWTRPLEDWLARQVSQYRHLRENDPERYAWALDGKVVARGPDCEPLLRDVLPLARLSARLLDEAERRYEQHFDAGHAPDD
jgi:hypothetical protein